MPQGCHGARAAQSVPDPRTGPDWVETRYRLLLGPGGRYRLQPVVARDAGSVARDAGSVAHGAGSDDEEVTLIVSDGRSCWVIRGQEGDRHDADPARTPVDDIVHPGRLLSQIQLTVTGTTQAAGRLAYRVIGVPRPAADWPAWGVALLDRVDLLVDAEFGMVLRSQSSYLGQPVAVRELQGIAFDPAQASDPASFRPPAGTDIDDLGGGRPDFGAGLDTGGLPSDGYEVGAGAIAGSLGAAAVRLVATRLARPEPPRGTGGDDEAAMPAAPLPDQGEPVSDQLLDLLARTDLQPVNLTADVHRWADLEAVKEAELAMTRYADPARSPVMFGFFNGESLMSRLHAGHRAAVLRVAGPDRYRIDYQIDDRPRQPLSVGCDAGRLRKAYGNRVIISPAQPMPAEFARLLDPAWLLSGWQLTDAGQVTMGGRRAFRLLATPLPAPTAPQRPGRPDEPVPADAQIDVLADAELGIILRQVSLIGGQPAIRFEIRNLTCHHDIDPDDFTLDSAPGVPVIESDGGPIHDLDLPAPVRVAGQAGADLLASAQSALSWLSGKARDIADTDRP